MHKLYKITNKVNQKLYIGITKLSLAQRWAKHLKDSADPKYPLHRAIRKYGAENFAIDLLEESTDRKIISEKEEPTILALNTRAGGYNVAKGGYGGDLGPEANAKRRATIAARPKATKDRLSAMQRQRQLGRTYSEELKAKLSVLQKARGGYGPSKHSQDTKKKMSIARLGKEKSQKTRQLMSQSAIINHNGARFNGRRACCLCCRKDWDIGNFTQHIKRINK